MSLENRAQPVAAPGSPLFAGVEPVIPRRGVHLDLKGVPPTPDRLLSLLDVFAAMRFNTVLVEWEDMFPWTCDRRFQAATAYTPDQVRAFAAKAKQLDIEVIPLVQCLGHMETPLRFPEYAHLREVPDEEGVLNPLAPGARDLVQSMVDDVLALMPGVKHFHLGGDEAWSFGTHPQTKAYIEAHGKGALYMQHVEPLLDHLLAQGIRPILWHDMMCEWDSGSLRRLSEKADLCVWGYQESPETIDPKRHFHISHIKRFVAHGITLWGATAYKGGDGSDVELPIAARRQENCLGWAKVGAELHLQGIFVTGWSRYNTAETQISPIDAALDVLALCAAILHNGKPPEAGLAACAEFLRQIGEYDRFYRCHAAMEELNRLKLSAWNQVRLARQAVACHRLDPSRTDMRSLRKHVQGVQEHLRRIDALTPEIMAAFAGLVPDIWMRLFVGDRREALASERQDIERLLGTL